MSEKNLDGAPNSTAVLQSMTLLASLSTAAEVCTSLAERRAGRDPSAQEPVDRAAIRLRSAGRELMDLLMQLALSRVPLAESDDRLATAVRHFDLLMKLRRSERLVQEMHQRLLSLYPEVSEELVEEARILRLEMDEVLATVASDTDGPHLSDVLERGVSFVVWMRHEVSVK